MAKSQPNGPKGGARLVRIARCGSCMCSLNRRPERVASITFSAAQEFLGPFLLQRPQVQVLIADLQRLLAGWPESGTALASTTDNPIASHPDPLSPPSTVSQTKPATVVPSRGAKCPRTPIGASEEWLFHNLLHNVKNHDDFLKFIGAEAIREKSATLLAKKNSASRRTVPIAAVKGQNVRRSPNLSVRQKKRKQK